MRVLGIDVGSHRIGLALSDPTGMIAQSLTVIPRTGWRPMLEQLQRIITEHRVERVVVGLPLRMDGKEGDAALDAKAFAERLQRILKIPVVLQDERLSTAEAERALVAQDIRREKRRTRRDAVAAALFLQTYLDKQRHERSATGAP